MENCNTCKKNPSLLDSHGWDVGSCKECYTQSIEEKFHKTTGYTIRAMKANIAECVAKHEYTRLHCYISKLTVLRDGFPDDNGMGLLIRTWDRLQNLPK